MSTKNHTDGSSTILDLNGIIASGIQSIGTRSLRIGADTNITEGSALSGKGTTINHQRSNSGFTDILRNVRGTCIRSTTTSRDLNSGLLTSSINKGTASQSNLSILHSNQIQIEPIVTTGIGIIHRARGTVIECTIGDIQSLRIRHVKTLSSHVLDNAVLKIENGIHLLSISLILRNDTIVTTLESQILQSHSSGSSTFRTEKDTSQSHILSTTLDGHSRTNRNSQILSNALHQDHLLTRSSRSSNSFIQSSIASASNDSYSGISHNGNILHSLTIDGHSRKQIGSQLQSTIFANSNDRILARASIIAHFDSHTSKSGITSGRRQLHKTLHNRIIRARSTQSTLTNDELAGLISSTKLDRQSTLFNLVTSHINLTIVSNHLSINNAIGKSTISEVVVRHVGIGHFSSSALKLNSIRHAGRRTEEVILQSQLLTTSDLQPSTVSNAIDTTVANSDIYCALNGHRAFTSEVKAINHHSTRLRHVNGDRLCDLSHTHVLKPPDCDFERFQRKHPSR